MSTIAFSKNDIAWDSQYTFGNLRFYANLEKVIIKNGVVYGAVGDAAACQILPEWHRRGAKVKKKPDGDWTLAVLSKHGLRVYDSDVPSGLNVALPFCIGSGGDFARAALETGSTALEAVKIAATLDVYTGGEIKMISHMDAFKTRRPKRFRLSKRKPIAKGSTKKSRSTSRVGTKLKGRKVKPGTRKTVPTKKRSPSYANGLPDRKRLLDIRRTDERRKADPQ